MPRRPSTQAHRHGGDAPARAASKVSHNVDSYKTQTQTDDAKLGYLLSEARNCLSTSSKISFLKDILLDRPTEGQGGQTAY